MSSSLRVPTDSLRRPAPIPLYLPSLHGAYSIHYCWHAHTCCASPYHTPYAIPPPVSSVPHSTSRITPLNMYAHLARLRHARDIHCCRRRAATPRACRPPLYTCLPPSSIPMFLSHLSCLATYHLPAPSASLRHASRCLLLRLCHDHSLFLS